MTKIYKLLCPITKEIRYVGKTIKSLEKRLEDHLYARNKSHKTSWIKSVIVQGHLPIIELIEECEDSIWQEREMYWIDYYKSIGCNLCNHTKGGEGQLGVKFSQETKYKMSISHKGIPKTEDQKRKLSISHIGKKLTEEHKLKMSKIAKIKYKGSGNHNATITEDIAKEIKQLLKEDIKVKEISILYNTSINIINSIKYNKSWKHV